MDYEQIKYEVSERILTVTLNRPEKLNADTQTMRDEVYDALANPYPRTPAMAAGVADHIWTIEDIVRLIEAKPLTNGD